MERDKRMRQFAELIFKVYDEAEILRDYAGGEEKEVFNNVRRALYDLKYDALNLSNKWENEKPNK